MPIYSIYKFTNLENGKIYIGKTIQMPKKRFEDHVRSANRGSNCIFHNAIRKYGISSFAFEVIFNTFLESDLNEFEIYFIKEHDCCILDGKTKGYNMSRGGTGFTTETAGKYVNSPNYINPWAGERGSLLSSTKNKERVANGTNPWAGEQGSNRAKIRTKKLLDAGIHHFQGASGAAIAKKNVKNQIENGTHMTQKTYCCPHCMKIGVGRNMFRWHFNHCRYKPLMEDIPIN